MASVASEATVASQRGSARADARRRPQDAATAAWLCAIPMAVAIVVAIVVLGPALGRPLAPPRHGITYFADVLPSVHPEPTEHARFLIAICAPLLGMLAVALAPRWLPRVPARAVGPSVIATQLALVGVAIASIVAQYGYRFGALYSGSANVVLRERYFSPATLAVAALLAAATPYALRSARGRASAAALLRESRGRRAAACAVAVVFTAIWMLTAIHSDKEIGNAISTERYNIEFTLGETFAVLDGRTPLVNFSSQYASLWPFAAALPMLAFGKTLLVWTVTLSAVTVVALVAIYGVLRRVVRSATAALLLYLPFLATSLFQTAGTFQNRNTVGSYYAAFPLRYGIPFFLAWLTARRIERRRTDLLGAWLLFTLAGLAILNNGDFGVPAFGATLAALLWSAWERPVGRSALRLAGAALAGLATAFALVSALTLLRTGSLPQLWRLVDYARGYTIGGFSMSPIPGIFGLHLLVYLTYVAAIVAASVRVSRGARNRVLTGMLAWAGVFGLGAGAYYVGRSDPSVLKYELPAWTLALALLAVLAIRELARPELRRTAIGALVVLFGFGAATCSLAQTPAPWEQIQRLTAPFVPTEAEPDPHPLVPPRDAATRRFVASLADGPSRFVVKRGAPVAILLALGHRVADAYGVVNVSPYTGIESMYTVERVDAAIDALRRAGGNTAILPVPLYASLFDAFRRQGFEIVTQRGLRPIAANWVRSRPWLMPWPGEERAVIKLVDMRHLHPRALAAG